MRSRLRHLSLLLGLLALAVGCQRGTSPVAPIADADAPAAELTSELSPLGVWRLAIDATSLEAEARYLPDRNASEQGDAFLLPLNRFITASTFELLEVGREEDELRITYRVTHPFAAPSDPTAPSSATNRADLGFAGVVLFLADVESAEGQTFFDDVIANTSMIANADAYWQPDGMIARTSSLTANCFPGMNVVDESGTGNRVGISNGGNPTGNFGTNGWTRTDLGDAPFTGWTGYGVLHQGQAADRTVALNLGTETSISLDVALIAKYTDPRDGSTPSEKQANRLPSKPADFTKFAYRMPHGALDVSECRVLTPPNQIMLTQGEPAHIDCDILDWDVDALESAASAISMEPDLGRILPGTSGASRLELDMPLLLDDPVTGQRITTGTPWSLYSLNFTGAPESSIVDGRYPALLRLSDPESQLPEPHSVFFDEQLQPLAALHPYPVTYQGLSFVVRGFGSWANLFQFDHTHDVAQSPEGVRMKDMEVDREGNTYVLGTWSGSVNFDAEQGGPLLEPQSPDSYDTFIAALTPHGDLFWLVHWPVQGFLDDLLLSPDGEVLYCGMTRTAFPDDFDPGPGIDPHDPQVFGEGLLGLRTLDGSYGGKAFWPETGTNLHAVQAMLPNGHVLTAMTFGPGTHDLDPGPGVQDRQLADTGLALVELQAGGQYVSSSILSGIDESDHLSVNLRMSGNASGETVVSGSFQGTIDFDPGPQVKMLTAPNAVYGGRNPFMLKLDSAGKVQWAQVWESEGNVSFDQALAVSPAGAPIAAGSLSGSFDADPGSGIALVDSGNSGRDILLQLNSGGSLRWASVLGVNAACLDLAAPNEQSVLASLNWVGVTDIDPSPAELFLPLQGSSDCALLAISSASGSMTQHRQFQLLQGQTGFGDNLECFAVAPTDQTLRLGLVYSGCLLDADPGSSKVLLAPAPEINGVVIRLRSDATW